MLRSFDRRLPGLLRGLTVSFSVLYILLFVLVAHRRLHYPFEIDRMESGMLTSVWRLRHGYPLYSAPSLEWAPFLYAPLFFYLSAACTRIAGIGYAALRLVSVLATLGSFGLIFALVWTETRRWAAALFAVGLFACLYPFVNAWYDVGRVDSLSLFFFLAALLATRRAHPALAAVVWLLAFLTKQTFLPFGIAVFLVEWRRPSRMLTGMITFGVLAAGAVFLLNRATHGWFSYFAFGTTGVIKWSFHTAVMFPFADVLSPLPIACALILAAALCTGVRWRERDGSYLAVVTVLVTAAMWYVRAHVGANLNAVIPLYAWLAILAGISVHRLLAAFPRDLTNTATPDLQRTAALTAGVWLLASLQLAAHLYRPAEIETGNLAARQKFLAALRATPGDVWVVDHSYDGILAGKPLHADMDALDAVLGRHYAPAMAQFQQVAGGGQLTAVVLDHGAADYQPEGIFTNPPFGQIYRLRVKAPGANSPGELDQPIDVLLPCTAGTEVAGSLLDTHTGYVDRSACPSK